MRLWPTNFAIFLKYFSSSQMQLTVWKKRLEMQTPSTGCSKAEPKIFACRRPPFPGVRDSQNLINLIWPPLSTNPVWWRSMHAISSYRCNRPTNTPTNRQDRFEYTAPQLSMHCNYGHSNAKNSCWPHDSGWCMTEIQCITDRCKPSI